MNNFPVHLCRVFLARRYPVLFPSIRQWCLITLQRHFPVKSLYPVFSIWPVSGLASSLQNFHCQRLKYTWATSAGAIPYHTSYINVPGNYQEEASYLLCQQNFQRMPIFSWRVCEDKLPVRPIFQFFYVPQAD